jgi:hypothetical protein
MLERHRRFARTIAFVVAALAVAGTSAAVRTPVPQRLSASGSIHVDPGARVAIQVLSVAVESGSLVGLELDARLDAGDASRSFGLAIESTDPRSLPTVLSSSPGQIAASFNAIPCAKLPCQSTFALIVTPLAEPPAEPIDLPWRVDAVAGFSATPVSASEPARSASLTGVDSTVEQVKATTVRAGAARLADPARFAYWSVGLHRDPVDGRVDSPIVLGILRPAVEQTAGPTFAEAGRKDRRITDRQDPPVQARVDTGSGVVGGWVDDRPLFFRTALLCRPGDACDVPLTIELAWADGRPETTFDAGWSLDLISIVPNGRAPELVASVDPVALPPAVTASEDGSFETTGPVLRGESTIQAVLTPSPFVSGPLGPIDFPSRGLLSVRVTSIGPTPAPADAEVLIVISPRATDDSLRVTSGQIGLRPGETGTVAFEPAFSCERRDGASSACRMLATITSSLASASPNQTPDGVAVRVDWTIELGVGLGEAGALEITTGPLPSAAASGARP